MSHKRYVQQTPGQIVAVAETLAGLAESLRSVATQIEGVGFSELGVTNHVQLQDGMEYIEKYVAAARTALREERAKRGDFGVPLPPRESRKRNPVSDSKSKATKKPTK